MMDDELREYALSLALKVSELPMVLANGKYSLHLKVDEDTYWGLIKLGAEIKTDCETYAENLLLQIEYIDEEDGSGTIHIEWDETDPDLQWWTDLGPEGQETFMIDALREALDCYVD